MIIIDLVISIPRRAVKGTDSDSDLAVIAVQLSDIPEETRKQIKAADLGDSDSLKLGQGVVAIGNALGQGQSVTVGYVSALNKKLTINDVERTLLQVDAAINPGNSGGSSQTNSIKHFKDLTQPVLTPPAYKMRPVS